MLIRYRIVVTLLLLIAVTSAQANDWGDGNYWRRRDTASDRYENNRYDKGRRYDKSLNDAVSQIRRRREGKVLSADTIEEDGRSIHQIRILNDRGRVRRLRFDGSTGRQLPRSHGNSGHGNHYGSRDYRDRR